MRKRGIIGTLLLLVYLAGVGLFTGPSLAQLLIGRLPQPRLELIPFADMISVLTDKNAVGLGAFVNIAGNIALLFPLGLFLPLFLPLFWRWFERAGRTIWWCFGTSLSIELIQLVAGGVTSADDLLLNTLGGAFGFAAAKLLMRACPKLAPQGERRAEWAAPLVCWLVIIAASTISDLLILW